MSECYRCKVQSGFSGVEMVDHPITSNEDVLNRLKGEPYGNRGIFLFCSKCDSEVTLEERWEALDKWKVMAIGSVVKSLSKDYGSQKLLQLIKDILSTELTEFPRRQDG